MSTSETALQTIKDSFPKLVLAETYDENKRQISNCLVAGHTVVLLAYWHIGRILRECWMTNLNTVRE